MTAPHRISSPWLQSLREGAVTGSIAASLSMITLLALGRREGNGGLAPLNGVSHWLWGDQAAQVERPTWRHTATGYVTHHLSTVFWAVLYARLYGHRPEAKQLPQAIAGAVATTAVAAAVDYNLVPKRLTPGFELSLSQRSTVATFGALAAGLALGALLLRQR